MSEIRILKIILTFFLIVQINSLYAQGFGQSQPINDWKFNLGDVKYGESELLTIEIKNPDLLRLYPPVLRVRGIRKTVSQTFQGALQTLIQEGVVTPEEAQKAMEQSH